MGKYLPRPAAAPTERILTAKLSASGRLFWGGSYKGALALLVGTPANCRRLLDRRLLMLERRRDRTVMLTAVNVGRNDRRRAVNVV